MSKKCSVCNKKINFFSSASCDYPDCNEVKCSTCYNIQECNECGNNFCEKHINGKTHTCDNEESDVLFKSKDDTIRLLDLNNIESYQESVDYLEKSFKDGFEIIDSISSKDTIFLIKNREYILPKLRG